MTRFLYLLLMVISVTQVFGECKVCGTKGTEDQKASFCINSCVVPDDKGVNDPPEQCELEKSETSCWYNRLKPKGSRCVKEEGSSELCYFQDLEADAAEGNACEPNAKCALGRGYCEQCTQCHKGKHTEEWTDPEFPILPPWWRTDDYSYCYLAQIGNVKACVFNFYDNLMRETGVDYCEAPQKFKKVCAPYGPPNRRRLSTDGGDRGYIYENISEGITWSEAQALCRDAYNTDLGTIIYDVDIQKALQEVGFGASPWIGMRSTDKDLDFSPVDCTECPVFHHGHSCRGCTEKYLWQNGLPIKEGGSHCVRLVPEDATITNDVDCDELLYAVLCNCEDTASSDCTEIPPYPYNE